MDFFLWLPSVACKEKKKHKKCARDGGHRIEKLQWSIFRFCVCVDFWKIFVKLAKSNIWFAEKNSIKSNSCMNSERNFVLHT